MEFQKVFRNFSCISCFIHMMMIDFCGFPISNFSQIHHIRDNLSSIILITGEKRQNFCCISISFIITVTKSCWNLTFCLSLVYLHSKRDSMVCQQLSTAQHSTLSVWKFHFEFKFLIIVNGNAVKQQKHTKENWENNQLKFQWWLMSYVIWHQIEYPMADWIMYVSCVWQWQATGHKGLFKNSFVH